MKQKVKLMSALVALFFCLNLVACGPVTPAIFDDDPGEVDAPESGIRVTLPEGFIKKDKQEVDKKESEAPQGAPRVLFDERHAQTAGTADWVIDGAFSDFADALEDEGFIVDRNPEWITRKILKNCEIYIIPEPNNPLKKDEQAALLDFVEQGGILFLIGDHYNADRNFNRWDSTEIFNGWRRGAFDDPAKGMTQDEANSEPMQGVVSHEWLKDNFGFSFRHNAIAKQKATLENMEKLGLRNMNGLSVVSHAGGTLLLEDDYPVMGLAWSNNRLNAWEHAVDFGVFMGGREEGPLMAIAQKLQGYVLAIADSSPFEDDSPLYLNEENGYDKKTYDGFHEADHRKIFPRLLWHLYENRPEIDLNHEATPTHPWEIPEDTYEAQEEPWRHPRDHYDWYDPDTHAPGSYQYLP